MLKLSRTNRQKQGVKKWINSGCKGTLQWSTGVGKTFAAIMAINAFLTKNEGKKVKVIVPTEYLKVQWIQELIKHQLHNYVEVEIINSAVKKNDKIDLIILDEAHRMASEQFYDIFNKRSPKLVLGLSATFNRLDNRHGLLNKYCPVCDIITTTEAVANGWLSPYKEYKVLIEPDDIEYYNEINEKFMSSFSYFNFDFHLAMECVGGRRHRNKVVVPSHTIRYNYAKSLCQLNTYDHRYYDMVKAINAEVSANCFTWNRALQDRKAYIMNHPIKIELTQKILNHRVNSKAITFSATIKQAEKIGRGFTLHSGKTKKKNKLTMEEFAPLKTGVINTSKSLDEGADVPGLNLAIILCNSSSKTQKTQRVGRVIRFQEGKSAEIFTLVLKGTVEEKWSETSSSGSEVIEISEEELMTILKGGEIQENIVEQTPSDNLFRF